MCLCVCSSIKIIDKAFVLLSKYAPHPPTPPFLHLQTLKKHTESGVRGYSAIVILKERQALRIGYHCSTQQHLWESKVTNWLTTVPCCHIDLCQEGKSAEEKQYNYTPFQLFQSHVTELYQLKIDCPVARGG